MNNRKNQNSILVLATLGVYLGLVLVGATPQVLAQAAMTRQFDVKDEIEVADQLDNDPDNTSPADITLPAASAVDKQISKSVSRFFAAFRSVDSINSIYTSAERKVERLDYPRETISVFFAESLNAHSPLRQQITITNLPRAGLDPQLASNAK